VGLGKPEAGDKQALPAELSDCLDVFSEEDAGALPPRKVGDHAIELTGDPPYGPIYNLSAKELAVLRTYIDEALKQGVIRPSTSPAGAPILFVPKKDGGLRLCVDYRGLNKVTIKNRHPLPLISETLDRLSSAKVFTKLDLKNAYYRLRIKGGDEWKTAFRTRYGHFEYLVMPFGLANAPATFQAYINRALGGLVDDFCVVYLDDILIYSENPAEHMRHVRMVLERLRKFSLYANPQKCTFAAKEVEFLGFLVSEAGVRMDPSRVSAIADWPTPTTHREVQVFLGFANFYRRFINRYSKIAAPLTELLKGSQNGKKPEPLAWNREANLAFAKLKACFTQAGVLRHFDPTQRIRIETDASGYAIAGILSQPDENGQWRPVAFYSRKMQDAELNWKVHDQELLAIIESLQHWRHYCEHTAFTMEVLTDHYNLKGFMDLKEINKRQARWAIELCAYDFEIKHRPGKSNPADPPSRRPDYACGKQEAPQLLPTLQAKLSAVRVAAWIKQENPAAEMAVQMMSPLERHTLSQLEVGEASGELASYRVSAVVTGVTTAGTAECTQLVPRAVVVAAMSNETAYSTHSHLPPEFLRELQLGDAQAKAVREASEKQADSVSRAGSPWTEGEDGLLQHRNRAYVPSLTPLRREILRRYHDDPMAGHFGREKTLELIRRNYSWPKMNSAVDEYIDGCDVCQRVRARRHKPYGKLSSLPMPDGPWQELTWDFITDLPPSKLGASVYDAVLVVVDRFTKMVMYIPTTKTITAPELADIFFKKIVARFGRPRGIVSDRGSLFTSAYWSEVCYHAQIRRLLSTAYRPQTDGQTERQNQILEHYLRAYCVEQADWASWLWLAEWAHNTTIHATTKKTPFEVMYGYTPTIDLPRTAKAKKKEVTVPAAAERVENLYRLREEVRQCWASATQAQARAYNRNHRPRTFEEGDEVLLSTKNIKQRVPSKKLKDRFIGPFRVLEVIGTQAYRLELPPSYRKLHNVFHVSVLEPYIRQADSTQALRRPGAALDDEGQEVYEIEKIIGHKREKGKTHYLVRWKGWEPEWDQYEVEDDLQAPDLIKDYWNIRTSRRPAGKKQRR
jgi:transposase InsO family protein